MTCPKVNGDVPVISLCELHYWLHKGWTIGHSWEYPHFRLIQPKKGFFARPNANGTDQIVLEILPEVMQKLVLIG